jgi:hypothetical protein
VIIIVAGKPAVPALALLMALLRLETALLLLYIEWKMVEVAMGRAEGLGLTIWWAIALIVLTALLLAVVAPRGAATYRAVAPRAPVSVASAPIPRP